MAIDHNRNPKGEDARESADARRKRQVQQNPSGHDMQVTPRQQQQVADSPDHPPSVATEFDEEALDDLKGENSAGS